MVIHYLMGYGAASSVHWQRQHLVLLGTQLNYDFN
jgi:hypothetical protein